MKNKTRNFLVAGVLIAGVAIAYAQFNGSDGAIKGSPTIQTTTLERGDISRTVATSGAVRPLVTVEVGSQLSGQISQILADFNSEVRANEIIALIDPQTFETRVLQNTADLKVAEANVTVQRAAIDRAEANLRRARAEYDRATPLADNGTLSRSELDTARTNYEAGQAEVTMAKAQLQNALATLEQRKAALESSQIDLERTKIRSPIDGVVIERAVDQGQTVAASLSSPVLFNIAQDLTQIQIEANVDEADIGTVRAGNEATFTVDAFPDREFSGLVEQVRLAPNEQNNVVTYTVIITAENPDRRLLPGMTAIVEIVTGKSEDVLKVANEAARFTPPEDSGWASATPAGAGEGRQRGSAEIAALLDQLDLDSAQRQAIETELREIFAGMRSAFGAGPPGGDATAMRERMAQLREQIGQKMRGVFERHLSAEQFNTYERIQAQNAETRRGTLWVQSADGAVAPVPVRFGISDDSHTQVLSQELEAGAKVVTRVREPRRS